jgi:hypothetical protein
MIYYYETPKYCIAHNPKVACTSFAHAIIKQFYPDINKKIEQNSSIFNGPTYILSCPKTQEPKKPIVCLIRNPIDRFISAINQTQINIETAIHCLLNDKEYHFPIYSKPRKLKDDGHFREQSKIVTQDTHLFKFPEEIEIMANFIGITSKIENLNKSNIKLRLTKDQEKFIYDYYYKDFILYEKVSKSVNLKF